MDQRANERTVWMNGEFMPESQALVPYRDRSFLFGDGAFDLTRTFQGRIFKLDEHIDRLYRSLKALHLDATMPPEQMKEITREVVDRNRHLLGEGDDYWVGQRLSRGVLKVEGDNWDHYGPTVIVECSPMPIKERAHMYRDGIQVVTPSVRRTPPECLTPRAKTPQLPEPDHGRYRGEGAESRRLGDPAGHGRKPERGVGLEHLSGQGWEAAHPA